MSENRATPEPLQQHRNLLLLGDQYENKMNESFFGRNIHRKFLRYVDTDQSVGQGEILT